MSLRIFQVRHCPFAQRARIALGEKRIAHDVTIYDPKQRPAELDAVSPNAKSPTIRDDDGTWVYESFVVVEYLEDRYPALPLFPPTAAARAEVRLAMRGVESRLMSTLNAVAGELVYKPPAARDPALVAAAVQKYLAALPEWNATIGDRGFVVGDSFTLADVVLFTPIASLVRLVGDAARIPSELRALAAWFARMNEMPSVIASKDAEA